MVMSVRASGLKSRVATSKASNLMIKKEKFTRNGEKQADKMKMNNKKESGVDKERKEGGKQETIT